MATIRQMIREATLSKEDRLLRKHGVVSDQGNITAVGRRVLADILFEEYKDQIVERVSLVEEAELKAEKKAKKKGA